MLKKEGNANEVSHHQIGNYLRLGLDDQKLQRDNINAQLNKYLSQLNIQPQEVYVQLFKLQQGSPLTEIPDESREEYLTKLQEAQRQLLQSQNLCQIIRLSEKPNGISASVIPQEIENLAHQLEAALKDAEYETTESLLEEISSKKNELQAAIEKGRQKKAAEVRGELDTMILNLVKIEDIQRDIEILRSLEQILKLQQNFQNSAKNDEIDAMISQLKQGLEEFEITEAELADEISESKAKMDDYVKKGRTKQAAQEEEKLKLLEGLFALSEMIKNFQSISQVDLTQEKARLAELLEHYELQTQDEVAEELESKKEELKKELQRTPQRQKKISELQEAIKEFEEIIKLFIFINSSGGNGGESQERLAFQKELQEGLDELELKSIDELLEEIDEKTAKIQQSQNKPKQLEKLQTELDNLNRLYNIHAKLNGIKNQGQGPPQFMQQEKTKPKSVEPPQQSQNLQSQPSEEELKRRQELMEEYRSLSLASSLLKHVIAMSECFEKSLVKYYYYQCLKRYQKEDEYYQKLDFDAELESIKKSLSEQMEIEKIDQSKVVEKVKETLISTQADQAMQNLIEILRLVRPFNFQEFFDLASQVDESSQRIKDKEIILLLGSTGCGKSTTIHYLCGSKMISKTVNGLPHIESEKVENPDLLKVKTSPFSKSETRFVTPITINLKTLGYIDNEFVTLVDTPGSEDTESPEIDMSNSLGIIKAIFQAKSVRPVIIFSYKNFGGRYEKLKALIQFYGSMINEVKYNIKKVTYFFTHVDQNYISRIKDVLYDVKTNLTELERTDENLKNILNDMIEKATEGLTKVINPLDGNPLVLIKQIKDYQPINYPSEVFQSKIHPKSHASIKEQFEYQQKQIMLAIQRQDTNYANFKLNEIKRFVSYFPNEQIYNDRYQEILKFIHNYLKNVYSNAITKFNRSLQNSNSLYEQDVKDYLETYKYFKQIDLLVLHHLSEYQTPSSGGFMANLNTTAQSVLDQLKDLELGKYHWPNFILKLTLIKKIIPEAASLQDNVQKEFKKLVDFLVSDCQRLISQIQYAEFDEQNQVIVRRGTLMKQQSGNQNEGEQDKKEPSLYESIASKMRQINQAKDKFQNVQELNKYLDGKHQDLQMALIDALKGRVTLALTGINEEDLKEAVSFNVDKRQVDIINQSIRLLEEFRQNFSITHSQEYEQIVKELLSNILSNLKKFYDLLAKQLNSCLQDPDQLINIRQKFDQIELLRNIPLINQQTSQSYLALYSFLEGKVAQQTNEIKKLMETIQNGQKISKDYYQKLREALLVIRDLGWIQKHSENFFNDTKSKIQHIFNQIVAQLEEEVDSRQVGLENLENLKEVAKVYAEIKEIEKIAKILVLEIQMENIKWKDQIELTVKQIGEQMKNMEGAILTLPNYRKLQLFYQYLEFLTMNSKLIEYKPIYKELLNEELQEEILAKQADLITSSFTKSVNILKNIGQSSTSQEEQKDGQFGDIIEANTQILIKLYKTTYDCSLKYKTLYKFIDPESNLISELNEEISKLFKNASQQLHDYKDNRHHLIFVANRMILSNLTKFDNMIEDKNLKINFTSELEKHSQKEGSNSDAALQQAQLFIDQRQFDKLNDLIKQLQEIGTNSTQQIVQSIKSKLLTKVQQSIKEIRQYTRVGIVQIDKQTAIELNVHAEDLLDILQKINPAYFDTKLKILDDVQILFLKIQEEIESFISQAKSFISLKKYSEAFQLLILAKDIKTEIHTDNQLIDCGGLILIDKEREKIQKQIETEIMKDIKEYETRPLNEYQFLKQKPKDLFENLLQNGKLFRAMLESFKQNIYNQIKNELQVVQSKIEDKTLSTKKCNKSIQNLENTFQKYLYTSKINENTPEGNDVINFFKEISKDIDEYKTKISTRKSDEQLFLQQIYEKKNISTLIEILEKNKSFKMPTELKNWINENLSEKCNLALNLLKESNALNLRKVLQEELPHINQYLSNDQIKKILTYKTYDQIELVNKEVKELFYNVVEEISKYFKENEVEQLTTSEFPSLSDISDTSSTQGISPQLQNIKNRDKLNESEVILIFIEFLYHSQNSNFRDLNLLIPNFDQDLQSLTFIVQNHVQDISQRFYSAVESDEMINLNEIKYILQMQNRSDKIIDQLKKNNLLSYLNLHFDDQSGQFFNFMITTLKGKVDEAISSLNRDEILNDFTIRSELNRKEHIQSIQMRLNLILGFQQITDDLKISQFTDIKQSYSKTKKYIESKVENLMKETKQQAKNFGKKMSKDQYNKFRNNYVHIKSIQQNLNYNKDIISECIFDVENQVGRTIQELKNDCLQLKQAKQLSEKLIELQCISENVPEYQNTITEVIKEVLKQYKQKNIATSGSISQLALILKSMPPEGANIVSEYKIFESFERELLNERMAKMSATDVISNLKGDSIDPEKITNRYNEFYKLYTQIVEDHLKPQYDSRGNLLPMDSSSIVNNIFNMTDKKVKRWTKLQIEILPRLLSQIFALWTIKNADTYFESGESGPLNKKNCLLQPHPAQVISIFRILGLGYKVGYFEKLIEQIGSKDDKNDIVNNFVQIKTGEGKSITLAVVSIILALFGFEVHCVCFSEYLSKRDYEAFSDLFQALYLTDKIKYGTFNQICENYLNQDGNIREIFQQKILRNGAKVDRTQGYQKQTVLLIDEVDVFFSKDFYGAQYRPLTQIQDPSISRLIDYIWMNRNEKSLMDLRSIQQTEEYQNCRQIFHPLFEGLLDEALKDMICDLKDYHLHEYFEKDGLIGYKDQDAISYNITYGYKTMFAYYNLYEQGRVQLEILNKQKSIGINCGEFSFAEIPHRFQIILGVTGTLDTLSITETKIIKEVYNIKNFTYIPSVYGDSNLIFNERADIIIEGEQQYFNKIVNSIKRNISNPQRGDGLRAVIIFFKNKDKLNQFFNCKAFAEYKENCFCLDETLNTEEKNNLIKKATYAGRITLATRKFGRGTDFICSDRGVEDAGGVHVIQTFLSEELSEEVQIKGRTCRQGNPGSYNLILLNEDLKEFNIDQETIKEYSSNYYEMLHSHRNALQASTQTNENNSLLEKKDMHEKSVKAVQLAIKPTSNEVNEQIAKFLRQINIGRSIHKVTKTLILMDATGSMVNLIMKTKNAIGTMFQQASKILSDKGIDPKLFEIQIGCYRNYSSGKALIFQSSPWESNPASLSKFLGTVNASGGQGNEAIEVALQYANFLTSQDSSAISQIFLIGDASPNTLEEVYAKRGKEDQWKNSPYQVQTFYEWELEKLKKKGIQVFTFYVHDRAQDAFQQIAYETGADPDFLDINNEKVGQEQLIKCFVAQILMKVGDNNGGIGKELVKSYHQQFK